jgi:YD repeat-containing protein
MRHRRTFHTKILAVVLTLAMFLAVLLADICLLGCGATGMSAFGSSRDASALWNQQLPDGGGAIIVRDDDSFGFWRTYQFDAEGRLVAFETFIPDGNAWSINHCRYDDQGRLAHVIGSHEGGGPNTAAEFETTYSYHGDGSLDVSRSEDGEVVMTRHYDADGRITELNRIGDIREVYEYDDRGRRTAHWVYGIQGDQEKLNWASSETYEYGTDERGDFERTYYYDGDTHQPNRCSVDWLDSQGNVIAYESMTPQGDGTWISDDAGVTTFSYGETVERRPGTDVVVSKTKTTESSDSSQEKSVTITYDEQGNPTRLDEERDGATQTCTVEYKGNVPSGFLDDELEAAEIL